MGLINEVRIGNWILLSTEPYQVTHKSFDETSWEETIPIELTEKIMPALGFEKKGKFLEGVGHYHVWVLGKINLLPERGGYRVSGYDIMIKTVHHIQNLNFALTNEELIYKR